MTARAMIARDTTARDTTAPGTHAQGVAAAVHVDVIVVGAGISGIGAGYHLQTMCPDRTYTILEGRADLGGTWDLFRYPGVRSDSDMHTLGYRFKPWTQAEAIADGRSILAYLRETATEHGIDRHIRFGRRVTSAEWSSADARWTVIATVEHDGQPDADGDATETYTCNFLFMCSGYYSYRSGYTPEFAGIEGYTGQVVHPQTWPEDLDVSGKRVVVIGSGATAMTLVPALAATAAHVTMLQRSPTYVVSRPAQDKVANGLRRVLPDKAAYAVTRAKNVRLQEMGSRTTRTDPDKVKTLLLDLARKELGAETVEQHFTPTYDPWDQRLCLIPDSDLFVAINSGSASVVTAHIDTFTEHGIRLRSGEELEADIVVTATGLRLVTLGEMDFTIDGVPVDFSEVWTYKGLAYSDVPNLVSSFGYINASWTLRSDMTCEYVCRLLNHMAASGTDTCVPRLRDSDAGMPRRPWVDDFSAGYMQRMMPMLPKQGDREPWVNTQSYAQDRRLIRAADVDDGVMRFSHSTGRPPLRVRPSVRRRMRNGGRKIVRRVHGSGARLVARRRTATH